jgi:hypothetical protein
MLKYPKDYEEAKIIIKNSVNDDLHRDSRKFNIKRSAFITALAYGTAVALRYILKFPQLYYLSLPLATVVSAESLIPFFISYKFKKQVEDETLFSRKTSSEIIKAAHDYVTEYNTYEREKQAKGK